MKEYSTINELIKNIKEYWDAKVIDGWKENKYWVSVLKAESVSIENQKTGKWKSFQRGGFRIKTKMPI